MCNYKESNLFAKYRTVRTFDSGSALIAIMVRKENMQSIEHKRGVKVGGLRKDTVCITWALCKMKHIIRFGILFHILICSAKKAFSI